MRFNKRVLTGVLALSLASCTTDELKDAGIVTACSVGAGGAALLACSLIAGEAKQGCLYAALAMATAGGLACYFKFAYKNTEVKDYEATKAETKYKPKKGSILKVSSLSATPAKVSPGDKTTIKAVYSVMTPDPQQDVAVTETWEFRSGNKNPQVISKDITVKPGTRQAESKIPVPKDAVAGAYGIMFSAKTPDNASDKKSTTLTIGGATASLSRGEGQGNDAAAVAAR